MYGHIDFTRIETDPGKPSAFAPPEGWRGDYRKLMRRRWDSDPGARQHIACVGNLLHRGIKVEFHGPYADEAREIVNAVRSKAN